MCTVHRSRIVEIFNLKFEFFNFNLKILMIRNTSNLKRHNDQLEFPDQVALGEEAGERQIRFQICVSVF